MSLTTKTPESTAAESTAGVTRAKLPPALPVPRLPMTLIWQANPKMVMELAHKRYGDMWTMPMIGNINFVFVTRPEDIARIAHEDPNWIHTGEARVIGHALLGYHSLVLIDDPEHSALRKLIAPAFDESRIGTYRDAMVRFCEEELETWPLNEPITLLDRMQVITRNVITNKVFGVTGERQAEFRDRIRGMIGIAENPLRMGHLAVSQLRNTPPPKAFVGRRDPLDAVIYDEIDAARRDPNLSERKDVLAALVQARTADGYPMTDRELRDTLVTLLIQGHASTATTLAWALEALIRHPEMAERVRAEVGTGSDEYVDAVITETLRWRSILPMITRRVSDKPYVVGGYELPPGTIIAFPIHLLHSSSEIYPEPQRFLPERWLEATPKAPEWMAFGIGVRHCLGRSFATSEVKAVLQTLLTRTRIVPADAEEEKIVRRGVLFSPKRRVRAIVTERLPPRAA